MKTIIIYASKYGSTREIAKRVAAHIEGAVTHDLRLPGAPPLSEYGRVIIGSPLYAGAIRKEAKAYMESNNYALRGKTLGLFICGIDQENGAKHLKSNFSSELLDSAKATAFLPSVYDPGIVSFFDRVIVKIAAKRHCYTDLTDDGQIQAFADAFLSTTKVM